MRMLKHSALAALLSLTLVAATDARTPSGPTIVDLAIAEPQLSILVDAVQRAGLVDVLSAPGTLTVFAPTNDAFVALLRTLGATSLDDIPLDTLRTVLLSHVVVDRVVPLTYFRLYQWADKPLRTAGPLKLDLRAGGRAVSPEVNGIDVIAGDFRASNGVVHVIGAVLPVPDARPTITEAAVALAGRGQFTALTAAVVKTGLADFLNNPHATLTVFAPTDAAFLRLGLTARTISALTDPEQIEGLRQVLLDHVVTRELQAAELAHFRFAIAAGRLPLIIGRGVSTVNGIPILAGDAVDAENGVIHVIDGVLLPRRSR